jgi:hypothetical protein
MPLILSGNSGNTTLDSSNGLTFSDNSLQGAAASPFGLKNRIINGDMRIDQRNAGASVTPANAADTYTTDRWGYYVNQASKITAQQSTTAPVGFNYSLKTTSSSAYTIGAGDLFILSQQIEGYNVADLGFGTANAKTFTLSFWVYSSLTGTFGGSFMNSAQSRSYPFTYTISSANTWEQKTITATADTTGTWLTTNGRGLSVFFQIGTGSSFVGTAGSWANATYFGATGATNLVATNGATFYITGVQLEVGSTATPFERRLYNQELANCQRYCYVPNVTGATTPIAMGNARDTTYAYVMANMPVTMRTSPSISYNSISNFYISGSSGFMGGTDTVLTALSTLSSATTNNNSVVLIATVGSAVLTQFRPTGLTYANTNGILTFSAEL